LNSQSLILWHCQTHIHLLFGKCGAAEEARGVATGQPEGEQLSGAPSIWPSKNPFNAKSKSPLHPPSKDAFYTLMSGVPIIDLYKATIGSHAEKSKIAELACSQECPATIKCGSTKGVTVWKKLFETENVSISSLSTFGTALAALRLNKPNAPFLHTNLHVEAWLTKLINLNSVEAADAYWAVSRGLEIIPPNLDREPTVTPNYYDKQHEFLVKKEIKRVMQDGYISTYEELRAIWPDLPEKVTDSLGLGFVVKAAPGGGLKVRLILDCSRPSEGSVNSNIKDYSTTLPTVVEFARFLRPGDWMASADIADAYMNLGLQPDNWSNVAINISLDSDVNIDIAYSRLAFGIRNAVRIFQALAELIKQMLEEECKFRGFWHLIRHHIAYIDDSAVVASTRQAASHWLCAWKNLMKELGLPWKESKITEPTQLLLLLGLLISSFPKPTISVEQQRLDKAVVLMNEFRKKDALTLREAQSIMGSIAFIAQVVRFATTLNRGLALQTVRFNDWARSKGKATSGRHLLSLDKRVLADWSILESIFQCFNGIDAVAPASYASAPAGPAQSDASFWGAGAWTHGHYSSVSWETEGISIFNADGTPRVSTTYVEALGLLYLLRQNAKFWVEKFIIICLDNSALVANMKGERSKSEQVLPVILECIGMIVAYAIKPRFQIIGTDDMWFADPLSRLTQPGKEQSYSKLFKSRNRRWLRDHVPWSPGKETSPPVPSALKVKENWEKIMKSQVTENGL
jgi:hypothetical protein